LLSATDLFFDIAEAVQHMLKVYW